MGAYRSNINGSWVAVALFPGDIAHEALSGESLLIESGALLAVSESLKVDVKFSGLSNIVLREGASMLRVSGAGDLLLGAYGGLQRFELGVGEHLIVDTGHLVGTRRRVSRSALSALSLHPLSSVKASLVFSKDRALFIPKLALSSPCAPG